MAKDTYRYKPHDEVYLVDGLQANTRYRMCSGPKEGSASVAYSDYYMQILDKNMKNRPLHIKKRQNGYYYIEEDRYGYKWVDEMLCRRDGVNFNSLL